MIIQPVWELFEQSDQRIEWCVEGLFPAESAGILAGPPNIGKSWMLSDLSIAVATGELWLGHFPTSKGTVLYIDEESNRGLLSIRLNKLLNSKHLHVDDLDMYTAVGQGLCFSNAKSVDRLYKALDFCKPSLVIIDSLIRVLGAEENSATDMARSFAVVKDIIREYSCTVIFADHLRKPGRMYASADIMLRGSSEKVAFVDSLLSMRRKGDLLIVEHSKSRFALAQNSFAVKIDDPEPDATTVAYLGEISERKKDTKQKVAQEFILETIPADYWMSRKDLIESSQKQGISDKSIDQVLKLLLSDGQIDREDRKPDEGRGGSSAHLRLVSLGGNSE